MLADDELETFQHDLETAIARMAEALGEYGADSPQFIAACDAHDLIEKRIKEIRSR
jgi:hypothetical protein